MIYGNQDSQRSLRAFLQGTERTAILTGPAHVGKHTTAVELFSSEVHPSDFSIAEAGVDGVREIVGFCRSEPLAGRFRVVLVDDAGSLGDPAQDALLKLTEDPGSSVKVVVICHDLGHLSPALRSRARLVLRWAPLNDQDMRAFGESFSSVVDEKLLSASSGLPGIYKSMMETSGFEDFLLTAARAASADRSLFFSPTPSLVKETTSDSPFRDAVIHVLRAAARRAPRSALPLLEFCSSIERVRSANPDIHWQRMTSRFLGVT